MIKQTAKILFDSCALDLTVDSNAARADFGIDGWGGTDPEMVYAAYNRAVRSGAVSLQQLSDALGDGPKLSALIGTTVKTVWDEMGDE